MTLFDFSLLTKIRPVFLAAAGTTARNAATKARIRERRLVITGVSLRLRIVFVAASVRPNKAAGQAERSSATSGEGNAVNQRADESLPALLIDNVVKSYGAVRALDGVSFNVQPGEFIALLGPERRRQVDVVSAALRPVRPRLRPHRGHGPRHVARSGAGAGAARHRVPAADPRSRAHGDRQSDVPRRPARHAARGRAGAHRRRACAARPQGSRRRQGRERSAAATGGGWSSCAR